MNINLLSSERIDKFFYYAHNNDIFLRSNIEFYINLDKYLKTRFLINMLVDEVKDQSYFSNTLLGYFNAIDSLPNIPSEKIAFIDKNKTNFIENAIKNNKQKFTSLVEKRLIFKYCVSQFLYPPPHGQMIDYREFPDHIEIILIIGNPKNIEGMGQNWIERGILYTLMKRNIPYEYVERLCKKVGVPFSLSLYNSLLWINILHSFFQNDINEFISESILQELNILEEIINREHINLNLKNHKINIPNILNYYNQYI